MDSFFKETVRRKAEREKKQAEKEQAKALKEREKAENEKRKAALTERDNHVVTAMTSLAESLHEQVHQLDKARQKLILAMNKCLTMKYYTVMILIILILFQWYQLILHTPTTGTSKMTL